MKTVAERWAEEDREWAEVEWTPELQAWCENPGLRQPKLPPPPRGPLERFSRWLDPEGWARLDALEEA